MKYIISVSTPDTSGFVAHAPFGRTIKLPLVSKKSFARSFESEETARQFAESRGLRVTDEPNPNESVCQILPA